MSIVDEAPRFRIWIRRHRWLTGLILVVVVACVAFGVKLVVGKVTAPALACGAGMYQDQDGAACIGVDLDSSRIASGEPQRMTDLESIVARNNDEVSTTPTSVGYVSIVLLLNLSPQAGVDTLTYPDIAYQIEGVITAVWQANHTEDYATRPKVKLFLANIGGNKDNNAATDKDNQWFAATNRILAAAKANHIVSVIGLGQSTDVTRRVVVALTDNGRPAGLPVIGGTVTGDTMNFYPGTTNRIADFYRVAPTNTQSVGVAAQRIRTLKLNPAQVAIVQDDVSGDDYVQTLSAAADHAVPAAVDNEYHFTSSTTLPAGFQRDQDLGGQFRSLDTNMCQNPPKAIYFAGRGVDLGAFVQTLEQSGTRCSGTPITIITGDDGGEAIADPRIANAEQQGVTVEFTALASPNQWGPCHRNPTGELKDFVQFEAAFTGQLVCGIGADPSDNEPLLSFKPADLDNGQAMIMHDDAGVAILAARNDDEQQNPEADLSDGGAAVQDPGSQITALQNMSCRTPFPGASGHVYYGVPETGNPLSKVLPIIQITGVNQISTLLPILGAAPQGRC